MARYGTAHRPGFVAAISDITPISFISTDVVGLGMLTHKPPIHLPDELEAHRAKTLAEHLSKHQGRALTLRLEGEAEPLVLSREVLEQLLTLLRATAQGQAVRVMLLEAELTTQEAADLLGVSRPFLVGLLEAGQIPHRRVGTHRRVALADLLNYQARAKADQAAALRELQEQAQKLGMGY